MVSTNPEAGEQYLVYETELNMKNISYPVSISKIDLFERQNDGISVNVFGFENGEIVPLKITKIKGKKHINLLFYKKELYHIIALSKI